MKIDKIVHQVGIPCFPGDVLRLLHQFRLAVKTRECLKKEAGKCLKKEEGECLTKQDTNYAKYALDVTLILQPLGPGSFDDLFIYYAYYG